MNTVSTNQVRRWPSYTLFLLGLLTMVMTMLLNHYAPPLKFGNEAPAEYFHYLNIGAFVFILLSIINLRQIKRQLKTQSSLTNKKEESWILWACLSLIIIGLSFFPAFGLAWVMFTGDTFISSGDPTPISIIIGTIITMGILYLYFLLLKKTIRAYLGT